MRRLCASLLSVLVFSIPLSAVAGPEEMSHPKKEMPASFDQVKKLVGEWEGTMTEGDKKNPTTATYELTSGGTAVVEKLMAGTPHEMVSVYHAKGDKLAMTHYCSLGNSPHLRLKKMKKNTMTFEMKGNEGIESKKEPHMHALSVTFDGPDEMTQEWTYYEEGKKKGNTVISMKRKK